MNSFPLSIAEHLKHRHCDVSKYSVYISEEERSATFMLFTSSGKLSGYQTYRPEHDKTKRNDEEFGRYYTYSMVEGEAGHSKYGTGVFGTESLDYCPDVVVLVEGIFKACHFHNHGVPCLAVLANDPKKLRSYLRLLAATRTIFVVPDNDDAGGKLVKFGIPLLLPSFVKDVDELSDAEFLEWALTYPKIRNTILRYDTKGGSTG